MQNNLILNRLVIITKDGKTAYDETFHRGVNIIRGHNSSGKSTIIRFIFYALGGCYSDFVPEALQCRVVFAEVEINGAVYTLKRYLERTDDGRVSKYSPMYIYYGGMEDSKTDRRPDRWQKYGYKTTSGQRSFSNVLFELMGLPEFKAESNITMHQILRLIYLDQESPLSSLFFFETFDQELTRETVAELLMGLYDEQLSSKKLQQIALKKKIDETTQAIRITKQFLSDSTLESPAFIMAEIEKLTKEMEAITARVAELRNPDSKLTSLDTRQKLEFKRLQSEVARLRVQYVAVDDKVSRLKADIQDSTYFVEALRSKIVAIERSIATREYFDHLHLEYCPECLTKIEDNTPEGHCRLCKSPIDNSRGRSQAMRIKLELDHQIRESLSMIEKDNDELQERQDELRSLQRQLTSAQKKYDAAVRNVRSTRDERIDQLLQDKGYKEGEIIQYRTLLESAEKYERLLNELAELKKQDDILTRYIKAAEDKIRIERTKIERAITDNGVYLLKNDRDRQAEFRNATDFKMNFKQNMAYLTDQHIKLSASSSFYLKLTARFAMFLASLQNDTMKYPRLIFSDNMEDKGMEEDRSRNFQNILVKRIKEIGNPDYQVIFATSNIAHELDTQEYTIGDKYTEDNKSLKIESLNNRQQ